MTINEHKIKMRKIILIIGLLISITPSNGQVRTKAKTMLEEFNLKGKVKSVTYEYGEKNHTLHFDKEGRLVGQKNVFLSGGICGEVYDNYIYEEGKLQSFDITREFEKMDPLHVGQVTFEYNSLGQLIAMNPNNDYNLTTYKYDATGNRIERYSKVLKSRQRFNSKGQVTEEWYFEDKETEVRYFGITDSKGNSLPDEIEVMPPYELAPKKYEYNEFADVISIIDTRNPGLVADTITLIYDSQGNWIERTAKGNSKYNYYLTTEAIYTNNHGVPFYGQQYVRRIIEYYE